MVPNKLKHLKYSVPFSINPAPCSHIFILQCMYVCNLWKAFRDVDQITCCSNILLPFKRIWNILACAHTVCPYPAHTMFHFAKDMLWHDTKHFLTFCDSTPNMLVPCYILFMIFVFCSAPNIRPCPVHSNLYLTQNMFVGTMLFF